MLPVYFFILNQNKMETTSKTKEKKPTLAEREKSLLREKEDLLEKKEKLLELQKSVLDTKHIVANHNEIIMKKIQVLRETIAHCYGQGGFGVLEPMYAKPILDEDDLIEYKQKLLELVKQL
jgi:uncharacterized protein YlxW (UPF0749 family)